MKENISNFIFNLKMYLKYIAKVGFKELFFDVLILIAMLIISAFAYVPVGLVEELVRNLITVFVTMNGIGAEIYIWIFNVLSALAAIALFIYLFNNRYDFKHDKVVPVEGSYTLERKEETAEVKKDNVPAKKDNYKKEEFDLPKQKEN